MRALLDLPCGTGRLFPLLGRDGHGFVGADVSLHMIEHARGKLAVSDRSEGGGLVQCDAERLPFKDRSFDAGVSLRFMLHLDRAARRQVLAEMSRVTRRWLVIDVRHERCVSVCRAGFASRGTAVAPDADGTLSLSGPRPKMSWVALLGSRG